MQSRIPESQACSSLGRRGALPLRSEYAQLSASTSQRIALSLRCVREASSSASDPPRPPPVRGAAGLPARRRCRPRGGRPVRLHPAALNSLVRDFRAGNGEFFPTATPGPEARAGQGRRPRPDHRAAHRRPLHRRDRPRAGRGRPRAEPDRDRRGDRRATGMPRLWRRPTPTAADPDERYCHAPQLLDFAPLPPRPSTNVAGLAADHPGPARPGPARPGAQRPATPAPRPSPRSTTCCPCWRSSSPRPAGSATSRTSPPTPARRCSPG